MTDEVESAPPRVAPAEPTGLAGRAALANLFVLSLLAGAGVTVMQWPWWLPILPMSIYLLVGLKLAGHRRANLEKFGDSLYFMGFIFTLISLIVAVGPWSAFATGGTTGSDQIISSMGTALVATIFGMTARLLILQFRPSEDDEDDAARDRADAFSEALSEELDKAIRALAGVRERVEQVVRLQTRAVERISRDIDANADKIKAAGSSLADSFDTMSRRITETTAKFPADEKIAAAFAPYLKHAQDISGASGAARDGLEQLLRSVAKFHEIVEQLEQDASRRLTAKTDGIEEQMAAIGSELATTRAGVGQLTTALQETVQYLRKQTT
jgi:hypothetical protein